jgi:hypothetical protein
MAEQKCVKICVQVLINPIDPNGLEPARDFTGCDGLENMRGVGGGIGGGGGAKGGNGGSARPGSIIYVAPNGVAVKAPLGAKVAVSNNGRGLNI